MWDPLSLPLADHVRRHAAKVRVRAPTHQINAHLPCSDAEEAVGRRDRTTPCVGQFSCRRIAVQRGLCCVAGQKPQRRSPPPPPPPPPTSAPPRRPASHHPPPRSLNSPRQTQVTHQHAP